MPGVCMGRDIWLGSDVARGARTVLRKRKKLLARPGRRSFGECRSGALAYMRRRRSVANVIVPSVSCEPMLVNVACHEHAAPRRGRELVSPLTREGYSWMTDH